jgi:cytidyltransferase-like protein
MSAASAFVFGAFDDLRARDLRFLEEAAAVGPLQVLLWSDALVLRLTGKAPKFPAVERTYFLNAVRYVSGVTLVEDAAGADMPPESAARIGATWVVRAREANDARQAFARTHGLGYRIVPEEVLGKFPPLPRPDPSLAHRKKIIVTGCYDWFHSGHVRFFEEVSGHGDVFVVVGNDANVRHLKGEGHPMIREEERRYVAGSIRFVTQALVSTGWDWLDAEPEIRVLKPDIYAVNEDGDRGGKRDFCAQNGIEYLVLQRTPAPGLPRRTSTDLRGF